MEIFEIFGEDLTAKDVTFKVGVDLVTGRDADYKMFVRGQLIAILYNRALYDQFEKFVNESLAFAQVDQIVVDDAAKEMQTR